MCQRVTPSLPRPQYRRSDRRRRGAAAVEAAIILPVIVTVMFGVWEVGRIAQMNQLLSNACREGARTAAGGSINGVGVTVSQVQQAVRDYMTSAGVPSAAVSGAQIELVNLSSNSWTNPCDAKPLDKYKVTLTIPSGAAFDSMRLGTFNRITGVRSMTVEATWLSTVDAAVTVDGTLPF
jgi:Flp pilus assembly protein TadG